LKTWSVAFLHLNAADYIGFLHASGFKVKLLDSSPDFLHVHVLSLLKQLCLVNWLAPLSKKTSIGILIPREVLKKNL
jgi:hypothetical protein